MSLLKYIPGLPFRTTWRYTLARISALEKRLAETNGMLDVVLADSEYTPSRDLGMNGQHRRKEVVAEVFELLQLDCVIETGTYLGATTGYFATEYNVPVYSSELMPRNHHVARRLLRNLANVHLSLQDSRSFLKELAARPDRTKQRPFFYLDAHWYDDLPLADEIDILAPAWHNYGMLIDDFQVPGDSGYEYDDYGPGKSLDMNYLTPILKRHDLQAFFPKAPSHSETGRKRGYVVVVPSALADTMAASRTLIAQ